MSDTDTTEVIILPIAGLNRPITKREMRERTHRDLVKMVGDRNRGPVTWLSWYGKQACTTALRAAYADDTRPIKAFGLDQFEAFFEEHPLDCCLIIASCEVRS